MQYVPDLLRPRLCSPLTSTLRTTWSHSSMSSQVPACAILSLFLPIATSTVDRIHLSPGDVTGARGRSMHWHTASQYADRRTDGRHKQLSQLRSTPFWCVLSLGSVQSRAENNVGSRRSQAVSHEKRAERRKRLSPVAISDVTHVST